MDAAAWERRTSELVALLAASAPGLRSLEFWYPFRVPVSAASALPAELGRLSQLTSLVLGLGSTSVSTAQVDAMVQALPSLQHLSLCFDTDIGALSDGFPLSTTSCCSGLRCLEIVSGDYEHVPPELGHLTALTRLELSKAEIWSLPDSMPSLISLRQLDLHGACCLDLPPGLTACQQLTWLAIDADCAGPVLARLQSLRYLSFKAEPFVQSDQWSQLKGLTELELNWMDGEGSDLAGLGGMTSLRKLTLKGCHDSLPGGLYLSSLESLHMNWCEAVPANLVAATQLRDLDLCMLSYISSADVAVLSSLPALSTLALTKQIPKMLDPHVWDEGLAQLRAIFLVQGRAPPVIS